MDGGQSTVMSESSWWGGVKYKGATSGKGHGGGGRPTSNSLFFIYIKRFHPRLVRKPGSNTDVWGYQITLKAKKQQQPTTQQN